MDFDRATINSEVYDPNNQVVLSTQTDNQASDAVEGSGDQPVTVTTNLPPGQGGAATSTGTRNKTNHGSETTNYQNSKTITNQIAKAASSSASPSRC